MKQWIKSNSPVAHAIDTNGDKSRTICGIIIVGTPTTKLGSIEKYCKKCLAYIPPTPKTILS